jgi:hypothetical protein
MDKAISIGSKKEGAKEVTVKVTRGKIFIFLIFCVALAYGISSLTANLFDNDILYVECKNGTKENITFMKEYYCGSHYTIMEGAVPNNKYEQVVNRIVMGE